MAIPISNLNACVERYPLSDFLPYIAYDDELEIYMLSDGGLGVIFECTPLIGANEEIARVLRSLYESSTLPCYTTINILVYASPRIDHFLKNWESRRTGIYQAIASMRRNFYETNKDNLFSDNSFRGRNFRLIISAKTPGGAKPDEIRGNIRVLKEELASIKAILKAAFLNPSLMEPQALITLMYELFNPNHVPEDCPLYSKQDEIRKQIIMPDNIISVKKDRLKIDDYTVQSLTVKSYPNEPLLWETGFMIGDICQNDRRIFSPFVLSLSTTILSEKDRKSLEMKASRVRYQALGPLAAILPAMVTRSENFSIATKGMEQGGNLVKTRFHIWVYGKNEKECNDAVKMMQTLYKSKGFTLQKDIYISLPLILTSLPLSNIQEVDSKLFRSKTMMSWNSVNISPILSDWQGTGTPEIQLFGRRGQVMYMDLFDGIEIAGGNANAIVAGVSGSGKSFFVNEIIMSYLGTGGTVRIIDVGRSYQNINQLLGGEFMEFTQETDICLNPFTNVDSIDDDMDILKPLIAQMASPNSLLDNLQIQYIGKAIKTAFDSKGTQTTITTVADILNVADDSRAKDISTMLFPYTRDGEYGRYFEGNNNIDFHNSFVVLELEELKTKKDLQGVVLLLLMYKIQKEMYQSHKRNRKQKNLILIDEAWALIGEGAAGKFIEEGYRRFRKYNGAAIAISQGLKDFYKNESTKAMLTSSDWQFILRQKPEMLEELYSEKKLDISKSELNLMKTVVTVKGKYSEISIRSQLGTGIGRLIVDPFSMLLYSTNSQDKARIHEKKSQGMSLIQAIHSIVEDDQKSCSS